MQKYVYLWGGSTFGIIGEVSRVDEQNIDRESHLKHCVREMWEKEHPGEFLQLVVSENRPGRPQSNDREGSGHGH